MNDTVYGLISQAAARDPGATAIIPAKSGPLAPTAWSTAMPSRMMD
jgi:hypothetical protein